MTSTLRYICSIFGLLFVSSVWGQSTKPLTAQDSLDRKRVALAVQQKVEKNRYIYQGAYLNLDIYDPIATAFNGGRFQIELSADVSLWQRLFPVLEIGYMAMNTIEPTYHYTSNGFFGRVGASYNLINFKDTRKYDHILAVGVRYAYAHAAYRLTDVMLFDPYWKETVTRENPWRSSDQGWVEFVATVRVQIYKRFFMGLTVRVQTFQHYYQDTPDYPTYIPGYGLSQSATNWGVDYTLSYQFPYRKKIPMP